MITKTKDFVGEAYVPNAAKSGQLAGMANSTDNNKLQHYINSYEKEYFLKALGVDMYTELLTYLEEDGTWKETAPEEWKLLVDGNDTNYRGMRIPCRDYIFGFYAEYDSRKFSTSGKTDSESRTSTDIGYVRLIVDAANRVFDYTVGNGGSPTIYIKQGGYAQGVFVDYSKSSESVFLSVYEFINNREHELFTEWVGQCFEQKNTYGI